MIIPLTKPWLGKAERQAVLEVIESGWLVQGARVEMFEKRTAGFTGSRYAIATTSCTTALHASLHALHVRPGDEVVVPAFTWIATANVVEQSGATPVFCDIDLETFNLDPVQLESCISPGTAGILPVHQFGLAADLQAIQDIATRYGLWLLEDAACGLGACYRGRHVGTFGRCGCFSFHPRKCITTGEGGMVITNDSRIAENLRRLRNHGSSITDHQRHASGTGFRMAAFPATGFNYRMTDLQAALGIAQMDRLPDVLKRRRQRAEYYRQALTACDWLRLPSEPEGRVHAFQSFVCLLKPNSPFEPEKRSRCSALRDTLLQALAQRGIASTPGTHAPPLLDYYRKKYGYSAGQFPRAAQAEALSFALPLYPQMTEAEQEQVVRALHLAWEEIYKTTGQVFPVDWHREASDALDFELTAIEVDGGER